MVGVASLGLEKKVGSSRIENRRSLYNEDFGMGPNSKQVLSKFKKVCFQKWPLCLEGKECRNFEEKGCMCGDRECYDRG